MPSQCNHVRACGLSNPLDAFEEFCTTYPDLKVNHCDSLQDVQLSQDLLAILQSDVVLDPRQTGPRTGLDTIKFAESNNFLAQLCVQSAKVAKNRLASRSAPFRHQQSNKAANQQAEQWAVFSEVISGPDAYVLKLLCHQLVWNSDADKTVKARVCAAISASLSVYAFDQLSKMPHILELQQRISKADMIWPYRCLLSVLSEMQARELPGVHLKECLPLLPNNAPANSFDKKPAFLIEPTTVAGEGPPQTFPSLLTPCLPTATAFNKLMSNTLHDTDWQTAVLVALWCTSAHKEAAQEGLRAALAGARKRKQGSALEADIGAGEPTYEQLLNTLDETWSNIQQADNNDCVFTEAAALILLKALDYSQPDEAGLASNWMMEYDPGTMTSEVRQAFLVGICTATDMCTVLSGLEMYSQEADQQPQLYSAVLQRLASTPGDRALQLYKHSRSQALPLCGAPPAAKLAEVAQLSLHRQDWDTALAAAQDMAAAKPRAAAHIVTALMDGIQTKGFLAASVQLQLA
ncbi:hypothetical protein ABBQ32_010413 [Trebouxia sp. C0010 RCD-2024]